MAKLGTIAGASTGTIQLTYLPQFITFSIATVPNSIRISVLGRGVVVDLDSAGITQLNGFEQNGLPANRYTFALADGIIKDKNVEITIDNADAAALDVYGWSKNEAANFFAYQRQTILANSGVKFNKFAALAIASPGTSDSFRITYQSGVVDDVTLNELLADVGYYQYNTGVYLINNLDQRIKDVTIIPTAQRTAYLMRFDPVFDEIDNAPVTSM